MSAEQVKKALESHGSVRSVVPYVVENPESAGKCPTPRIPDVSLLHNYQYCNDGVKVWKAYNIGTGKLVTWENLDKDGKILLLLRIIESGSQGNSESVKKDNTCLAAELPGLVKPVGSTAESVDEDRDCGLFSCPEPGCVKQYITVRRLEKHIAAGKHAFQDVSEPLGDKVIKRWAEQFQQATSENLSSQLKNKLFSLRLTEDLNVTTDRQVLQKGWALKVPTRATRFPDKVRNYLQEKFDVGNATGHKADPLQVSMDMRCARDELGRHLFAASERLQTQQIRSFFSRLAAAQRKKVQSPTDII